MKTVFKALAVLLLSMVIGEATAQTKKLQVRISSSTDDAEERGTNATSSPGRMDITSSDIELMNDGGDGDQFVGLRFPGITIPSGAIITNAYVQFTVDETDNSSGTVIIKAEDTDNGKTFSATDFDISSRSVMGDSVVWSSIPDWTTAGDAGADQQTPDISTIVQAVIDRAGWSSGNALNLILTGTGERTAEAYDGTSSAAPMLVVEYIEPVTETFTINSDYDDAEQDVLGASMDLTSSDIELTTDGTTVQLIGLRYSGVNIPNGAVITNAYIQFTVDEVNSTGDVDVLIAIEDEDNAAAISSNSNDLSGRSYSDSIVLWNNIPGWNNVNDAGSAQQTPDLTKMVQLIVNRKGWESGNALLFGMIDPSVMSIPGYSGNASKRVAQTRDKSASRAPKLIVTYIPPAVYQDGGFPIVKKSSWKFKDDGRDLSNSNWTEVTYNDSSWKFGNAVLGYNNADIETPLDYGSSSTNKHITTYLRHTFKVDDASIYDSLIFDVLRDDGVVVYVNGTEAFRMNMPSGSVDSSTLAVSAVGGSDETTYFQETVKSILKDGRNVIAVELHQNAATSSDLSFDMEVGFKLKPLSPASYPFEKGTAWHYLDDGSSLDTVNWTATSFDDDNWAQGKAPLGYGDPMETEISFGSDPDNKHITYYFRRDIDVTLANLPDSIELGLRRDDGAIVYINGKEVMRDNLPSGTVTSTTLAPTTISGSDETTFYTTTLYKSDFKDGVNTLAVEVHNRDLYSSDLGFDLYLDDAPEVNKPRLGCTNGQDAHIACFTSIAPTGQTPNLIIPEGSHRFQQIFNQGDQYTDGSGSVPGNHDFTGYVAKNGSSTEGYLSVNHENTPGGVSILDVRYNDTTNLWEVGAIRKVDFYNNDLVTTTRNCSGGITPWGTIITAEETTNNGDVNGDGYTDVGWLVEIDPVTAKVKEYGNGKQEKLWGCGRISHENAVVLNDSMTLFTGEDGGSSAVFKFVADKKMDLSSGKLYALQLDAPLVSNDPTSTTAKWIEIPNSTQTDRNNTRSLASSLGATNFNGVEDIEVNPITGDIFFAAKGKNRVYAFTDGDSTVTNFRTFVGGTSYILNTEGGVFTEPWSSGNDNLTFDDNGNLWVLQDGGRNYIWMVRPDHTQDKPKVELFSSFPNGSEPTGLTFTPDHKFGFVSVQHPSGSNTGQLDATFEEIRFNRSSTFVFSRSKYLGAQSPVALFEADNKVVVQGEEVEFTDISENNPTDRLWIFNGGTPAVSTKEVQKVTYNGLGTYKVELQVSNAIGADTVIEEQYIEVIQPAPVTNFYASDVNIVKGDMVTFTDISSNAPTSYEWTFEGGSPASSTAEQPQVTYNAEGTYTVTLKTANRAGEGSTETKTNYITVSKNLGVNSLKKNNGLKVYPNPTEQFVTVSISLVGGEEVAIDAYDLTGKKLGNLLVTTGAAGVQNWKLDLNSISQSTQVIVLNISVNDQLARSVIQIVK